MSLFDPPKEDKLSDVFPMGEHFWLLFAEFEGVKPTAYGNSAQASVAVCPVGDTQETKQFRVWGVLATQIQQMGDDDLPAEVYVGQQGRKHVWALVRKLAQAEVAGSGSAQEEPSEPPY